MATMTPPQYSQGSGTITPPNTYGSDGKGYQPTPNESEHTRSQISGVFLDIGEQEERDGRLMNMGREMAFRWVGPIEPEVFLDTFLSPKAETASDFTDSVAGTLRQQVDSWVEDTENVFTAALVGFFTFC
jgi:hypothetical protein